MNRSLINRKIRKRKKKNNGTNINIDFSNFDERILIPLFVFGLGTYAFIKYILPIIIADIPK